MIIGIITPDELITDRRYEELPFAYSKADHKPYYKDLTENIHDTYFNEYVNFLDYFGFY